MKIRIKINPKNFRFILIIVLSALKYVLSLFLNIDMDV